MIIVNQTNRQALDVSTAYRWPLLLLSAAYFGIVLTMLTELLVWISILASCALIIRLAFFKGWHSAPLSPVTINLLAILAAITLAWFSLSIGLLLSMVNLLVMACAFKLMRVAEDKDLKQLFVTLLFLTACGFIFNQSLYFAVFYTLIAMLLLLALLQFNAPQHSVKTSLKLIGIQLLQAFPIAILLFLILPQLPPLWQMPTAKTAKTGLTDQVSPGDIADLSQSSELAFRAMFDSPLPTPQQRYWRVMTLEQFDGNTWSISPTRKQINRQYRRLGRAFTPSLSGPSWRYQIIAEPSHQRWLFGLDIATAKSSRNNQVLQGFEYQLVAERPLLSPLSYQVESFYQQPLDQTLFSVDQRINLQLPASGNPQTQEWVKALRAANPSAESIIDAVRTHFMQNRFRYTLRPDPMPTDPVDQFMFESQAGFCAHYASALTYVLRLAGIPARMVTGYQGGEQQMPSVLSVYQYDAHAWVETWYDDQGWRRIDPTGWVSPDRIDFGLETAMRDEGSFLADSPLSLARFKGIEAFNQLRLWFAQLDYQWSKWVLGFDQDRQDNLLQKLFGQLSTAKLSLIGVGVILIIGLLLVLYILPSLRQPQKNKLTMTYQAAADIVAAVTKVSRQTMGPDAYLNLTADKLSAEARHHFSTITALYQANQYQPPVAAAQANSLRLMQKELKRLKRQAQKSRS